MTAPPELSIVVPCYNEADGIDAFHARLVPVMQATGATWEVVYVNDGSRDLTLRRLEALRGGDRHVGLVNLSRNFGKEVALTAGLDHARATGAIVAIDADLQDPPELIAELVRVWRDEGFDHVFAQRRQREGETWLKRTSADQFYRLMHRLDRRAPMPRDTGDFRLLSRRALDGLLQLREQHRFMKGIFAWIGFPSRAVVYDRAPRHAGSTSWTYWQLWNLALEGITSSTLIPLRLATYLGLATAFVALVYGAKVIIRTLLVGSDVPGYPSLMTVILFLGGVQLITLGVIGEYLGRVFNESKDRPLYLVERSEIADPTARIEPARSVVRSDLLHAAEVEIR